MGFRDIVSYTGDLVKNLTPDLSTAKRVGSATYRRTSAAVSKIIPAFRVDVIDKLPQYHPDDETTAQIGLFATTFAKNAGKYAVTEGIKQIPGVTVACKLFSDTKREVEQEIGKGKVKSISQPENFIENSELRSQKAVEDESEKTKVARSRM